MTALEQPDTRTPAQQAFDKELAGWEASTDPVTPAVEHLACMAIALSDQIGDLRGLLASSYDDLAGDDRKVESRLFGLESAMNQLQPCPELPSVTLEAYESKPVIRVRIQHSNTIKEGWRLAETTVEYSGETVDWDLINAELSKAFEAGTAEAKLLNHAAEAI